MRRCCKQIKERFDCEITDKKCPDPCAEECEEPYWDYLMKMAEDFAEKEVENP